MYKSEEARAVIKAYQAGGASDRVLELFWGVITNAARQFSNKALADNFSSEGGMDPKLLGRVHALVSREDLGKFRPYINRAKYADLMTDMSIKLLDACRTCSPDVIENPPAWAKAVLWNHGRDLANHEKKEFKLIPPKAARYQKSGDEEDNMVEGTPDPQGWASEREPQAGRATRAVGELSLPELERYYEMAFSEEFRTCLETSVGFVAHYFRAAKPKLYRKDYTEAKSALDSLQRLSRQIEAIERRADKEVGNRMTIEIEMAQKFADDYWHKRAELDLLMRSYKLRFERPEVTDSGFRTYLAPDIYVTEKRPEPAASRAIWTLNISPLRMMRDIWIANDEIKRRVDGTQNCRYKLALIFWCQKRKAEGTDLEILFQKLQGDSDLENLRKYQYRELRKGKHAAAYRWLVRAIYKRSFVDKWDFSKPLVIPEKL